MAPIENLRFDDSIFHLFGDSLENLTDSVASVPLVGTYNMRWLGGSRVPGMLLNKMEFTL